MEARLAAQAAQFPPQPISQLQEHAAAASPAQISDQEKMRMIGTERQAGVGGGLL
jgi:hypothetical protein